MSRISVILPAYNAAATLAVAGRSILDQSARDLELILVDDGSTDATPAVCEELSADPRATVRRIAHGGVVAANNAGLEVAAGEYIARMDADDWSAPDRLARQSARLDADPGLGVVGCLVEYGGDRGAQAGYAAYVDWTNRLQTPEQISLARFIELPIPNPSIMYRRGILDQYGGYRHGDFPEDYDMILRWLDAGVQMAKVPQVLLRWNDPPTRLSRTDDRYRFQAFYRTKAEYLARWLARNNPHHPRIIVWGASRTSRQRAELLVEHGIEIAGYIDVDPKKCGTPVHGRPRYHYTDCPGADDVFVVSYVAKRGARGEITAMLTQRGFVAGKNYIHSA